VVRTFLPTVAETAHAVTLITPAKRVSPLPVLVLNRSPTEASFFPPAPRAFVIRRRDNMLVGQSDPFYVVIEEQEN
jgi:hypothetical protein